MLTTAVASKSQRTLACHYIPEEIARRVVGLLSRQFCYTFKTHHFGHLGIGMHVVQYIDPLRHRCEESSVGKTFGADDVFRVMCDGEGIGDHLIHSAVLIVEHPLHLLVCQTRREVDGPVDKAQKQFFRLLIATIDPCVTQSRKHLVQVVERCPRTEIGAEVAFLKSAPQTVTIGHATYIPFPPFWVIDDVGVGTSLQF